MIGKALGPYEILEPLGAGGMGEVYLGQDTRLGRKVAIKVLPPAFATDPDRLNRFEQEARAAAALNHPHIAVVHDIGVDTSDPNAPNHYIVQEYLQGQTLTAALQQGPLPLKKALAMATEVAEALAAAHSAGIVHRDLKPDNVFLLADGHVKLLDFGLAKLIELPGGSTGGPSMSPTVTSAGLIMGTAGYMAPEQVRGEEVDQRADLFAFGCVLYEMVTGSRAFRGDNVHEILSRILTGQPEPPPRSRTDLPLRLQWLLDKALEKEPELRYQGAGDVVVDLRAIAKEPEPGASLPGAPTAAPEGPRPDKKLRGGPSWQVAVLGAVVLATVAAATTWLLKRPAVPTASGVARFDIQVPYSFSSTFNRMIAIAPDGKHFAINDGRGLTVRPIDALEATPVGIEAKHRTPFFSPDSRQLGYWENEEIRRVAVSGGPPAVVGAVDGRPLGASWGVDGYIYVGLGERGIWRFAEGGGEAEQVVTIEPGRFAHGPELLPGGEWLLYTEAKGIGAWNDAAIVAHSLSSGERREILKPGREVRYSKNGYLTYVHDNILYAIPFDAKKLKLTGSAVPTVEDVRTSTNDDTGAANYDIADNGTLVWIPSRGSGGGVMSLVWLGRDGSLDDLPLPKRRYGAMRLSPDDRRLAAQVTETDGTHIWIHPVERAGGQRLTSEGRNWGPVWSPDGEWVYFASDRNGNFDVWRRRIDLSGPAEAVFEAPGDQQPSSISSDGTRMLITEMVPSNRDIALLTLDGTSAPETLVASAGDEYNAHFSPDGRFFCFQSDETGGWEIHVMELATRRRWVVSPDDGYNPFWLRDGSGIVFNVSGGIMLVEVAAGSEFRTGEPRLLFDTQNSNYGTELAFAADGSRVLVQSSSVTGGPRRISPHVSVTLNWFEELEARSP